MKTSCQSNRQHIHGNNCALYLMGSNLLLDQPLISLFVYYQAWSWNYYRILSDQASSVKLQHLPANMKFLYYTILYLYMLAECSYDSQ